MIVVVDHYAFMTADTAEVSVSSLQKYSCNLLNQGNAI